MKKNTKGGSKMKKHTKLPSRALRAQVIFDGGIVLDHWMCDWDPVEKETRSNASVENIVSYKGKEYGVISDGDTVAYDYYHKKEE